MALTKGSKRLFDWLKNQQAGTIVTYEDVMSVAEWSDVSLSTYLKKNKVAPFLQRLADRKLKILMEGDQISAEFFDETFTQTAPRLVTLSAGDQLQGERGTYELVEPIGNGAVGRVWSARTAENPELVAVKVMLPHADLIQSSKLPNVRERFRREARNGQVLTHPNIVRYLDSGQMEKNPFLIMELADRSVADRLGQSGSVPEEEAAEIVECCVAGLKFLHGKGCPHRDIKPANILEFSTTFKLGDLGIVKWSDFDLAFTRGGSITRHSVQLGSWFYMAPEQQESPHDAVEASDTYALGITWIELLVGTVPAPQAVGAGAYQLPVVRKGVTNVIQRMCSYDPAARPSLTEIEGVIQGVYGALPGAK